jgi:hypothetical protein
MSHFYRVSGNVENKKLDVLVIDKQHIAVMPHPVKYKNGI